MTRLASLNRNNLATTQSDRRELFIILKQAPVRFDPGGFQPALLSCQVVWDSLSRRGGKWKDRTGSCQVLLFPRIIRLLSDVLLVIKELF